MELRDATIQELAVSMQSGAMTSKDLVEAFRQVIASDDGAFNAIAFPNPDAEMIADALDCERAEGRVRGPLHGVPILIKDNLNTGDTMMTSAGSLALDGSIAPADSHVVARLRNAGAVVLGKTNLSEWANFRSARPSSGWSSRGGQVRNAYALDRSPGGSSSGSAVATARGYCAGAVGTETDGSIVGPSAMNAVVGIKPTVGLVSRAGIIPIASSQDTAGPMARTVADAACILSAMVGTDPGDPATAETDVRAAADYTAFLDREALRGARIGVVRSYTGFHDRVDAVFEDALRALTDGGAKLTDGLSLVPRAELRPHEIIVLLTEFKVGLNAYLASLGPDAPIGSLADLIAFNETHAGRTMPYFGQELFIKAEATGGLQDRSYLDALATCHRLTREDGIDRVMHEHGLHALIAPTASAAWAIDWVNGDNNPGGSACLAAVAGYASVTVPMGNVSGLPVGISFFAGPWSEGTLIGLAHAFENIVQARIVPGAARNFLP
ncbi:MAG: amidase [Rhodospirillaceae bacterium]|jgi:amidase|nr:amidase [Rhodospirillaceae bacterium]MBT3490854.1 amidase [Rhodospirillaceae bacterium]MBT3778701.1 amidase [Rhodospirillaceae bacterium]MBT3976652.1 amidase [Rhodospirillaceae bacterium]MBT4171196.1 amidase [Rhodospirillaceae bacterium]